tara:strand:+ start:27 stop:497 length:471 start_codon:yes stop_codon:yes gene_type:complete
MSKIKTQDKPSIQPDTEGQTKLKRELSRVFSGRGTPKSRGSSADNSNYQTSRKSVMVKQKQPLIIDQNKQRHILEEYADSLITGAKPQGRNRVLSGNSKESPSLFYNSKNNYAVMKSGRTNVFNTNNLLTENNSLERNRRSQKNLQNAGNSTGKSI